MVVSRLIIGGAEQKGDPEQIAIFVPRRGGVAVIQYPLIKGDFLTCNVTNAVTYNNIIT